jgi:hypothetical protein
MSVEFSLVPYGVLYTVVPGVTKYLEVARDWARGRVSVDDLLRLLFSGQMQLWVFFEDGQILGQLMTEVKQYPQCRMLAVQYCATEPHLSDVVEDSTFEVLEKYAKELGCAGVEMTGRSGWSKHVAKRGYDTKSVVFQKFFE